MVKVKLTLLPAAMLLVLKVAVTLPATMVPGARYRRQCPACSVPPARDVATADGPLLVKVTVPVTV